MLNFNVSSIKNKTSQNKINACMNSVKNIINDYKPIENKKDDYDIFKYNGPVNKDTHIEIEGKKPSYDVEVIGSVGGTSFFCGTLTTAGMFNGRDLEYKSFESQTESTTTKWTYPGVKYYTTEVKVGTEDLKTFTIPGTSPTIIANKSYDQKEVIYTPEMKPAEQEGFPDVPAHPEEILFTVTGKDLDAAFEESASITVGQCMEYKEGICLAVINDILKSTFDGFTLLKMLFVKDGEKFKLAFQCNGETERISLLLSDTTFTKILFAAEDLGKEKFGISPETYEYSKDQKVTEEDNKTIITTKTVQPRVVRTEVVKEGNEWKSTEHYELYEETLTEKSTINTIGEVRICQIYE